METFLFGFMFAAGVAAFALCAFLAVCVVYLLVQLITALVLTIVERARRDK